MVRQCYGRRRKEYLSFLGSSVLLKDFSLIITYGNLFLGKTEIVSVKQMLRYVKQFSWNGFHVFFPICFCRLIHRNMNCACSRSINTSSKVTDPSVDATWLRLQSMQHLGYVCNHHQSPILWMRMVRSDPADFLIHDVADSKLEMFDDFCKKKCQTWCSLWPSCSLVRMSCWETENHFNIYTLHYNQLTPSFASALFEHFSATVHAMILTS